MNTDQPNHIDFRPIDTVSSRRRDAIRLNTCSLCGGPADEFTDELSRREFGISGACQTCQDKIFG